MIERISERIKTRLLHRSNRILSISWLTSTARWLLSVLNIVLVASVFGAWSREEIMDKNRITQESGFCYVYALPYSAFILRLDSEEDPTRSKSLLTETGQPLGPSHSLHGDIRDKGQGRYSHWDGYLYFSSSDNSNPITNGRVYAVKLSFQPPAYVLAGSLLLLVVSVFGLKTSSERFFIPAVFCVLGIGLVALPFELFLRTDLAKLHFVGAFGQLPARITPTLNSQGYRDYEHSLEKSVGKARILLLGDSMTFGWGIADHEIYPRRLSELAGDQVEIISLARNGWSTADQLLALRREGLAYKPDIVVIGVVTNDPGPLSTDPSGQQPEWRIFRRLPLDLQFWRFLDYHINRVGDLLQLRYSYSEWESDIYDPAKKYRGAWEGTVGELAATLKAEGIPGYAFILVGPVKPRSAVQARKYTILKEVFSKAGFHTISLLPAYLEEFRGIDDKTLGALPDDSHPGPEINRFFANKIWAVLEPEVNKRPTEASL